MFINNFYSYCFFIWKGIEQDWLYLKTLEHVSESCIDTSFLVIQTVGNCFEHHSISHKQLWIHFTWTTSKRTWHYLHKQVEKIIYFKSRNCSRKDEMRSAACSKIFKYSQYLAQSPSYLCLSFRNDYRSLKKYLFLGTLQHLWIYQIYKNKEWISNDTNDTSDLI